MCTGRDRELVLWIEVVYYQFLYAIGPAYILITSDSNARLQNSAINVKLFKSRVVVSIFNDVLIFVFILGPVQH